MTTETKEVEVMVFRKLTVTYDPKHDRLRDAIDRAVNNVPYTLLATRRTVACQG